MKFTAAIFLACLLVLATAQQVIRDLGQGLQLVRERGSREIGIDHTGRVRVFTSPGSLEVREKPRRSFGRSILALFGLKKK